MRKLVLVFFLVSYVSVVYAQDYHKIDSLKNILNTLPEMDGTERDTLRISKCNEIGLLFLNYNLDSSKYWFTLVADTVFSANNIIKYPRKAYYNATAIRFLGIVSDKLSDYHNAMAYFSTSKKIYEKISDRKGIASGYMNIGLVYKHQGDFINAIESYKKSLLFLDAKADKTVLAKSLNNLANAYMLLGDYANALLCFEQGLKIFEVLGDKNNYNVCLAGLGAVFYCQGNYPKAIEYFEKTIKYDYENQNKSGLSSNYNNLGNVYFNMDNYPRAIEYFEKSMKINNDLKDKAGISVCMSNLGVVYLNQSSYPMAIEYFGKSLEINNEIGNKDGISSSILNLGIVAYAMEDYTKAKEYFLKSLELKKEIGMLSQLNDNYIKLASLCAKQKRNDEAADFFFKSNLETIKLLRDNFSLLSESEKGDFFKTTEYIFNGLAEFASIIKTDSVNSQCYDNELLLKGLLLNNSSSMMKEVSSSNDSSLINSFRTYKLLRNKISVLQSTPINKRTLNLDSLENLANKEEVKLVKLSKDFAKIQKQYSYKWQDVQKNLKENDVAIEFIRIKYKLNRPFNIKNDSIGYGALILRSGDKYPQIVTLCSEAALQKMVGELSWSDNSLCKMIYQKDSKKGLKLYTLLIKPLEPYINGTSTPLSAPMNIYYAPAGMLNQISFAAIPTPDKKLLSDKYNLNMVSSTRVLIDKEKNEKPHYEDAVVYGGIQYDSDSLYVKSLVQKNNIDGTQLRTELEKNDTLKSDTKNWDYLPGTQLETDKISKLLKKKKIKTTYYSAYNGLEECFKTDSTSASIIHIATHGFSFPTPVKGSEYSLFENSFVHNLNPLFRSGLLFAGANRTWSGAKPIEGIEDGVLTAYEVSNLNLSNTKLVVLSACETGLGDLKGNEGVYGLQRAFKMAGVKYIVMSLWKVPDAQTVELMEYFYKELLSGKDIRKAFAMAQNKMKEKYEPYYWAGFVLIE